MIAGEVAEHGFSSLKAPIVQVTALDATVPYSEPLEAFVMPDEDKVVGRRAAGARAGARDGVDGPPLGREQALGLLATMWRIRLFEERVGRLKQCRRGPRADPPQHRQEGVAAAVCSQLRDDDAVYSGHRAHGHAIAKGAPLDAHAWPS